MHVQLVIVNEIDVIKCSNKVKHLPFTLCYVTCICMLLSTVVDPVLAVELDTFDT